MEHLVDGGRRNTIVRTAHFLLELGARPRLVGLATNRGYSCPLAQPLLADALGLTAVHVNRVLRELREDGLLTFPKRPGANQDCGDIRTVRRSIALGIAFCFRQPTAGQIGENPGPGGFRILPRVS